MLTDSCGMHQGQADVEAEMRENEDRVEYLTEELRKAEAQHDEVGYTKPDCKAGNTVQD